MSGVTPDCTLLAQSLYQTVADQVVVVSSPAVAEAAKVLENTYRFVNIALVNEFALFCHERNINIWDVIAAAATKPYGFSVFWPGPGVGGHCIPIDPVYLSWKARQHGKPLHIVEVARDTNEQMPEFVVQRIADVLNRDGLAFSNAQILVLGITYKPGVSDTREAPSIHLLRKILRKGAQVSYHDPLVPQIQFDTEHLQCVPHLDEALQAADIVVIATDHPQYDWDQVETMSRRIFDTRGVFRKRISAKVSLL